MSLIVRLEGELEQAMKDRDAVRREDQEVRLGLRIDVPDRYEAVARTHVIALANEAAEQAVR